MFVGLFSVPESKGPDGQIIFNIGQRWTKIDIHRLVLLILGIIVPDTIESWVTSIETQ